MHLNAKTKPTHKPQHNDNDMAVYIRIYSIHEIHRERDVFSACLRDVHVSSIYLPNVLKLRALIQILIYGCVSPKLTYMADMMSSIWVQFCCIRRSIVHILPAIYNRLKEIGIITIVNMGYPWDSFCFHFSNTRYIRLLEAKIRCLCTKQTLLCSFQIREHY